MAASLTIGRPISAPVRPRFLWVDAVRACAILMVVATHVVAAIQQRSFASPATWWPALLIHVLVRPCVPLFVMLSGMLLLDPARQESIRDFLRKRFSRVLIPYLFWTCAYLALNQGSGHPPLTAFQMLTSFVETPVSGHLWFVQMILGVYLATPILRLFVRAAAPSDLNFFCLVWSVWLLMNACQTMGGFNFHIKPYVATSYIGYFLLGYMLRTVPLHRTRRIFLGAAFFLSFAFTAIGSHFAMAAQGGRTSLVFMDNLNPNLVILSASMLLLLRDLPYDSLFERMPWLGAATLSLSRSAYSIYLAHVFPLVLLGRWHIDGLTLPPMFGIPMAVAITVFLTWVVVMAMRRVPYLRAAASG